MLAAVQQHLQANVSSRQLYGDRAGVLVCREYLLLFCVVCKRNQALGTQIASVQTNV
jgi:hypothetical protein